MAWCIWQCDGTAEVDLASSSLEALSLSLRELPPSGGTGSACAFPRLLALTYDCKTKLNSVFKELLALESLRFGSHIVYKMS